MKQYIDLVKDVLENGTPKQNRTNIPTPYTVFGRQIRFDLSKGLPVLTTKKMALKACIAELLWFIEGSSDERRLAEIQYDKPRYELKDKRTIWSDNYEAWKGKKVGECCADLGSVYGIQWRHFAVPTDSMNEYFEFDQLTWLINELKTNPNSRRLVVSAWNVPEIDSMALPPCHALFQFYVNDGKLSCQLYQRSADTFLGVPFNIASYALLLQMMAQVTGLKAGDFVHTLGDTHIYLNHLEQVKLQLTREPRPLPKMKINPDVKDIFSFKYEDFELVNYDPWPHIAGKVSV